MPVEAHLRGIGLGFAGEAGKAAREAAGEVKEVAIEYIGNLPDLDLKPITISGIKGFLTQFVQEEGLEAEGTLRIQG